MDPEAGAPATLVDLLRARAAERPDAPAFTFLADGEEPAAALDYAALDLRARSIAATLQDLGATGERVLLLLPSGLDFVAGFFGCLYAGAIAVPAYPPELRRSAERLRGIAEDSGARFALTTSATLRARETIVARAPELARLRQVACDELTADRAPAWRDPGARPAQLAFLQYTSGSIAAPKGVMVSHANVLHNERLIAAGFRQADAPTVLTWLPLHHDMGLIGHVLHAVHLGAPCVLMSPLAFLQRPIRWLRAISTFRATHSGGPDFAFDLCVRKTSAEQRAGLDLRSWTSAPNGAEPIRAETLERFAEAFAPAGFERSTLQPCYGLAEATLLVTSATAGPTCHRLEREPLLAGRAVTTSRADAKTLVCCGAAPLDQRVLVVDPQTGTKCPDDRVGEIWVAGPSVTQGYWNRPAETLQTFGARLADEGDGDDGPWLRTGDLGFVRAGRLVVTGRLKELIVVNGRNIHPQDIERTVERSHEAVRPGCVAAFSLEVDGAERVVVAVEIRRRPGVDAGEITRAVRTAVAMEHEVQLHAVSLLDAESLPRTTSGKLRRLELKAAFAARQAHDAA